MKKTKFKSNHDLAVTTLREIAANPGNSSIDRIHAAIELLERTESGQIISPSDIPRG